MRSARLSTRARRAAMLQVGALKQGTAPHRRSLWRWPGENPSAIVGSSADNSSSSVRDGGSPRRAGDDVIYLALHQSPQRGAFTLLLKRNAGMLLLASAADAKMGQRGAWRCGLSVSRRFTSARAYCFYLPPAPPRPARGAARRSRTAPSLVAGNTLTKGIEVVDCNGYDLARRHTPFCRVELRHRRELSQSNKTSSFRAAAPRGAATLHRTMMSIFSHNGTA